MESKKSFGNTVEEILHSAQTECYLLCPISDGSNVMGVGIFNAPVEEVKKIMDEDPGVKAGVIVYEIHASRSFPGDSLPK